MARSLKVKESYYIEMRARIFNMVGIGTVLLSLLSVVVSLVSSFDWYTWSIAILSFVGIGVLLLITNYLKCYGSGSLILSLLINIIIFPLLFLTNGGTSGVYPLFFIVGLLFTVTVLRGGTVILVTAIEFLFYVLLFYIDIHFVGAIARIDNEVLRFISLAFGLLIGAIIVGYIYRNLINQAAIERKRVSNLLKRDPLTKIYNRRYLMDVLTYYIGYDEFKPLTIIMFDIDDFKTLNERFGYVEGDLILQNFARILQSKSNDEIVCGRYDGEEFMVILPKMPLCDTLPIADEIRTLSNEVVGIHSPVTISGGIASYLEGEAIEQFIKRVDKNLYLAKKEGKNQIKY